MSRRPLRRRRRHHQHLLSWQCLLDWMHGAPWQLPAASGSPALVSARRPCPAEPWTALGESPHLHHETTDRQPAAQRHGGRQRAGVCQRLTTLNAVPRHSVGKPENQACHFNSLHACMAVSFRPATCASNQTHSQHSCLCSHTMAASCTHLPASTSAPTSAPPGRAPAWQGRFRCGTQNQIRRPRAPHP
jgi:hypothetical protein